MTERTIPILPTRSIDDTIAFYEALGFEVTYRQERPNIYAVVVRGGIELQFFVLKGLDPENTYSTCYVLVSDVDALYEAFAAGLRTALGRVPLRGIPRLGALRDMTYGVRQFVVVDPGGNRIRIGQPIDEKPASRASEAGRLERAVVAATTLADSRDDAQAAADVLDSAFAADPPSEGALAVRALILRADVATRLGDTDQARRLIRQAEAISLTDEERRAIRDELRRMAELADEVSDGEAS